MSSTIFFFSSSPSLTAYLLATPRRLVSPRRASPPFSFLHNQFSHGKTATQVVDLVRSVDILKQKAARRRGVASRRGETGGEEWREDEAVSEGDEEKKKKMGLDVLIFKGRRAI
ncbi:hypothetical protein U1Q18_003131 [Sarracenia purpurea var. burkii]